MTRWTRKPGMLGAALRVAVLAAAVLAASVGAAAAAGETRTAPPATGGPGCASPPIDATCPAPIVSGFFPSGGPVAGGTTVTILGSHFQRCGGVEAVLFDGVVGGDLAVESDTRLTVVSPPHEPGYAQLVARSRCGQSYPALFTYAG
jgi:hypothetical protein